MSAQLSPATALPLTQSPLLMPVPVDHAEPQYRPSVAAPDRIDMLGVPITLCDLEQAATLVADWAKDKTQVRLVTFTNVHMLTDSYYVPGFRNQLRQMDLNCLDGMPLVWLGRLAGKRVTRVCGPDFFEEFFASSVNDGLRHFFVGGKEGVAAEVAAEFSRRYQGLNVAGVAAPPFRALTPEEDEALVTTINESGADVVWVSLGCPKQEAWIYEHRDKLNPCVVLAVGQAFDIIVGDKKRPPSFVSKSGFEWLYRLAKEPRRLVGRYAKSNCTFFFLLLASGLMRTLGAHRRQQEA